MITALQSSASGMYHAANQLTAVASNVANVQSQNYQAWRVEGQAQASGGVSSVWSRDPTPVWQGMDGQGLSNVELDREAVSMISALRAYEANAAVFRGTDQMIGTLLDRFA